MNKNNTIFLSGDIKITERNKREIILTSNLADPDLTYHCHLFFLKIIQGLIIYANKTTDFVFIKHIHVSQNSLF